MGLVYIGCLHGMDCDYDTGSLVRILPAQGGYNTVTFRMLLVQYKSYMNMDAHVTKIYQMTDNMSDTAHQLVVSIPHPKVEWWYRCRSNQLCTQLHPPPPNHPRDCVESEQLC